MIFSKFPSFIWPWAISNRMSGKISRMTSAMFLMFSILLWTRKIWPPLSSSLAMASLIILLCHSVTNVFTGTRLSGADMIIEMSLRSPMAILSVLGIGVAVIARKSTLCLSFWRSSFCLTPKRCSSSTMIKPKLSNLTLSDNTACVPIKMSQSPDWMESYISFFFFVDCVLDSNSILIGHFENRSLNDWKCWFARIVVGTMITTWWPFIAEIKAALMATSVFPNPTSPQIKRSIFLFEERSFITSSIVLAWSWVNTYSKSETKLW